MKTLFTYTALLALPAVAQRPQQNESPQGQGMMQGGMNDMMQNMQAWMMMMQSMHGGMMGGMQDGPGGMQDGPGGMQRRMMNGADDRGGIMGMMQQPMHRSMMLVHVLPTMQEPLNLNDTQVARLQGLHEELMASHGALREQMQAAHSRLRELAAEEDADPSEVETMLKSAAEQHAEMQASMFATAQKMRNHLAEQRAALADIP